MNARIGCVLIALNAVIAAPLSADFTGITTKTLNFPATPNEVTLGPDGNIWVLTVKGNVGKLTPAGVYTEFSLPFTTDQFGIPYAQTLTSGADGNIWIAALNGHIERVTRNGTVTDFTAAPSFYPPPLIVSGADGAVWFFDRPAPGPGASNAWKLGRIDIYGNVTSYDLGISNDQLRGLISGGDGSLWFINESKNQVVRFSLVSKSTVGTFSIPSASNQNGDDETALGWDGNVWFTRGTSIDRVKVDGTITEFHVPSGGQPAAIVMSGDGNLWFTEPSSGKLGQLALSSITGGSAAIVESSAVLADAFELFILPSSFVAAAAASNNTLQPLGISSTPCPPQFKLVKTSPSTSGQLPTLELVTIPPPTDCLSITTVQVLGFGEPLGAAALVLGGAVTFDNFSHIAPLDLHPLAQTGTLTATLNLTAAPGITISRVSTDDPTATASFAGLTATLTKPAAIPGDRFSATVFLTAPQGAAAGVAGALVISSSVTDSNPTDHVSSFFLDTSSIGGRFALPPNGSDIVTTPVHRGH
jgi:virginiamycin B lyase